MKKTMTSPRSMMQVCILATLLLNAHFSVAQAFSGGAGTVESPYEIATLADLQELAATPAVWNANFIQTADIDATATTGWDDGAGWIPIGNDTTRFTGYYDGEGHVVSNLWINRPATPNVGLFGHVGDSTAPTDIRNLGVLNATVVGARGTGSLIGRVTGNYNTRVEACYALDCSVVGDGATGGLVGSFNSYVSNSSNASGHRPRMIRCHARATVSLSSNPAAGKDKFGALAGCLQKGYAEDCFARGAVTAPGGSRVGGLAGCIQYRGQLVRCYATTAISATGATGVGGLIGYDSGTTSTATDCFWDTQTSGQATSPYGTGATTEAMKTLATFTNAGWDFVGETANGTADLWHLNAAANDGYPSLVYAASPVHKVPQETLVFSPPSPQTYATTNNLAFSGGSGVGATAFSVVQGPGLIVNATQLVATAGSGTIHVRIDKAEDDDYLSASATAYVETAPKAIALTGVSIANKVFDGTPAATASGTPALIGIVAGDDVQLAGTAVYTFESAGPGTDIPVTVSGLVLDGEDASNYTLAPPALSADILPQPTRIRIH